MEPINFADIELTKLDMAPTVINYNGQEIAVKKCISIDDKYNFVAITLQQAMEDGIYNEVKLDMFFALNLVFKYAEIVFSVDDHLNASETFDKLNNSGLLVKILNAIPQEEKEKLYDMLNTQMERNMRYGNSLPAVLRTFIDEMPKNAELAKEIIESFDKDKYQEVVEFAKAANGGKPITVGQN